MLRDTLRNTITYTHCYSINTEHFSSGYHTVHTIKE